MSQTRSTKQDGAGLNQSVQHGSNSSTLADTAAELETQPELVKEIKVANEPPNGGLEAWTQVVGAHFLFFNSWGIVNTFGVYQYFYERELLQSHEASEISWIGTLGAFLLVALSIVSGPIFDRGHTRALLIAGTFFTVFGLMMTSLSTKYWQLVLAQGICVGIGSGLLFLPSVAIVSTYFTTKRAVALGIVAAGGSIGSVIYPIVFVRLQPRLGFPWTTRIIAFIALGTLLISIAILKQRVVPGKDKARAMLDINALKSIPFVLFSLGLFLTLAGLYIPIFYIIIYAQRHASISTDMSFYLLAILNGASVFGRILPGILADKVGAANTIVVFTLGSAIVGYIWIVVDTLAGLVVLSIIYGFLSGAVVSLPPTLVAGLVPELRLVGTWMGMCFCVAGMGILIGSPIAGTLVNTSEGSFSRGFIFSGSLTMAGAALFAAVKVLKYLEDKKQP